MRTDTAQRRILLLKHKAGSDGSPDRGILPNDRAVQISALAWVQGFGLTFPSIFIAGTAAVRSRPSNAAPSRLRSSKTKARSRQRQFLVVSSARSAPMTPRESSQTATDSLPAPIFLSPLMQVDLGGGVAT